MKTRSCGADAARSVRLWALALAAWHGAPIAFAAEAAGAKPPDEQDFPPLQAPAATPTDGTDPTARRAWPAWTFSAFLHGDLGALNDASRLNPDNSFLHARSNGAYVETRFTAFDTFGGEGEQHGRWLFKSYTASSHTSPSVVGQRSRVDEAYVDWKTPAWFLTAGKRRVNWGHALGFNPVNVIAPPRNPLDPSFQTEGQPMVWGSVGSRAALDVLVTRGNDETSYSGDRPRWGLRWSMPAREADFALYAFDGGRYAEERTFPRMLGASFSMNVVPGVTLYGEFANFSKNYRRYYDASGATFLKTGSVSQAVVGSQLDLGGKSSAYAEVFIDGAGDSASERSAYLHALDVDVATGGTQGTTADFNALNRAYLLAGLKKEYREKYTGSASVLLARDRSFSSRFEAVYALSDYYEVKLSYIRNGGSRGSEFGNAVMSSLLQVQLSASF